MDIELARTFLAVLQTGSFVAAGEQVGVTQSTVSMRIRALEELLDNRLFERGKQGAELTPAGAKFQRHAIALVRLWEQARQDLALPAGSGSVFTVAGPYSLWEGVLIDWLALMRAEAPEIGLRTRVGFSDALMQALVDGMVDLAVVYTPQHRPGLSVERLLDDELVLVSSGPDAQPPAPEHYVYVDWGPEFAADHGVNLPQMSRPGLRMESGALALRFLLAAPGSGYFPLHLVRAPLAAGRLHLVEGAPRFAYPVFAVYATDDQSPVIANALALLRRLTQR